VRSDHGGGIFSALRHPAPNEDHELIDRRLATHNISRRKGALNGSWNSEGV
jgi:hypothetical protein